MNSALKHIVFVLGILAVWPLIVICWVEEKFFGPEVERMYGCCKEMLALVPTPIGNYMRQAFYWACCKSVARFTSINFGAIIAHRNTLIADGVVIGSFSIIGTATIGRNVLIAPRVSILSGKYQHGRPEMVPSNLKGDVFLEMIMIGDNCFIGQSAVVLANIGSGSTVGAGSVVNRDVPGGMTVMGNPARRVSLAVVAHEKSVGSTEKPESTT